MIEQRFWDKVTKTSSCWFWTGAKRSGYGIYTIKGKNYSAHRITYEDSKGAIAAGLEVDHICMNRNCVNPEHHEAVDRKENLSRGSESARFTSTGKSKKSYLLYIHDERFRSERQKSGLVNELLAKHYAPYAELPIKEAGVLQYKLDEIIQKKLPSAKPCKIHGTLLDSRGRCLQKGCKYN